MLLVVGITANLMSLYKAQTLNKDPLTIQHFKLLDGTTYTPASSKPVMLHFWATWCPVCKAESSNIELLSKHYEIITIAVNSGTGEELKRYLNERELPYKVVNDNDGVLANHFHISAYPTTLIYDANRELTFKEVGYTSTLGLWLRLLWAGMK